jgi:hypothetical protein
VAAAAASSRAPAAIFRLNTAPFIGKGVFAVAAGALSPSDANEASFRLIAVDTNASPWATVTLQPRR